MKSVTSPGTKPIWLERRTSRSTAFITARNSLQLYHSTHYFKSLEGVFPLVGMCLTHISLRLSFMVVSMGRFTKKRWCERQDNQEPPRFEAVYFPRVSESEKDFGTIHIQTTGILWLLVHVFEQGTWCSYTGSWRWSWNLECESRSNSLGAEWNDILFKLNDLS